MFPDIAVTIPMSEAHLVDGSVGNGSDRNPSDCTGSRLLSADITAANAGGHAASANALLALTLASAYQRRIGSEGPSGGMCHEAGILKSDRGEGYERRYCE